MKKPDCEDIAFGALVCFVIVALLGVVPGIVLLFLAHPMGLWERGDGSEAEEQGLLEALFFGAFLLLVLAGCGALISFCFFIAFDPGDHGECRQRAEKARREGRSYARDARHHHLGIFCFWLFSVCPCLLVVGFVASLVAWDLVARGVPLDVVCGVCVAAVAGITVFWCCTVSYVLHRNGDLSDQGLRELRQAADAIDDSIESALRDGSLRLLRCAWLLEEDGVRVVQRRQDLPTRAFASAEDAAAMHKEGRVYVLSYGWLQDGDADPHGLYLCAVRRFLRSLGPTRAGACGLFWDYACLPQKPRDLHEELQFQKLLGLMGNLYGSMWRTTVLQHKLVPHSPSESVQYNTRPYDERGWCTFEEAAASLAAGHRLKGDRGQLANQQPKLIEISGADPNVKDARRPPTLKSIEERIAATTFTGSGDREKVVGMIRAYNTLLMVATQRQNEAIRAVAQARRREDPRPTSVIASVLGRRSERVALAPAPAPGEALRGAAHAEEDPDLLS